MKPVYIFGHKNPDTDSVCSAIALSYLKNKLGLKCEPRVIGPINRETKFALDYFKVDEPAYLNDVKVQINDINYVKRGYISETESIAAAFDKMHKLDLTGLPLVDSKRKITGYVNLKSMAKYLIGEKRDYIKTNLKFLLKTLDAKLLTNFQNDFEGHISTVTFSSDTFIREVPLSHESILVVGDRYKVIEYAIESKVQLIILTRNRIIPVKLMNKAIKNKVSIITSSYSSFELCNKLSLCNYIKILNETTARKTLDYHGYYSDFIITSRKQNYSNYPIINKKGECLGTLRIEDAINYEKKRCILVDHNNYEQSVDGLNEAEILEVFDHHNIGNIGTNSPIYFTCRPVGCTGTIIFDRYKKEGVTVPKNMAGLMLSAIISDTLMFTSPTTTLLDQKSAEQLAKLAGVKLKKYGMEMLKAASSIKGMSVTELINQDFKSYSINDKIYGIAVITTMDFEEISKEMDKYIDKLNEMSKTNYKAVLIFIVDILKQGSYILYNTDSEDLVANSFGLNDIKEGVFVQDLISRKKQIIPAIMKELER